MANSLYDNNANKDGELSPVTPAIVLPTLEYPVEGIFDAILYLGKYILTFIRSEYLNSRLSFALKSCAHVLLNPLDLLYLGDHVFHAATALQSLLHTFRPLVKHSLDNFVDWYLGYRLDRVLVEHRLLRLLNLFRGR